MNNKFYSLSCLNNKSKPFLFDSLKGKVVLIVNVASGCGFTHQYSGLQKLYDTFKDKGFEIIAFPCDQFGNQEPGTNDEIEEFCSRNFKVTFQLMDKCDVNGDNEHPVWNFIKTEKPGFLGLKRIKWNFEKFLIDKQGNVVERFSSITSPESLSEKIQILLNQ